MLTLVTDVTNLGVGPVSIAVHLDDLPETPIALHVVAEKHLIAVFLTLDEADDLITRLANACELEETKRKIAERRARLEAEAAAATPPPLPLAPGEQPDGDEERDASLTTPPDKPL